MPKRVVVHQCGLQAVVTHLAGEADLLGLPRRSSLFGEERFGIGLSAQRALLPSRLFLGVPVEEKKFSHGYRPFLRRPSDLVVHGPNILTTLVELHACRTHLVKRASGMGRTGPTPVPAPVTTSRCERVGACRTSRSSPGAWAGPASCRGSCTASPPGPAGIAADASVTVVANTADDLWVHGLKVCPDLDTVMYTLGDGIDPERGWGRREDLERQDRARRVRRRADLVRPRRPRRRDPPGPHPDARRRLPAVRR